MISKIYLNRLSFTRQASAVLAASAALALGSAQAGTLLFSSAAPTFDGDDITQSVTGTLATDASNADNANYIAADRPAQGQSFTVTTAGNIQAITLKSTSGAFAVNNATVLTVRLNTISGTTLAVSATDTATVGTQARAAGNFFTFTFAAPVAVTPGTYGFDFGLTSGGGFFQIDGAPDTSYTGGSSYSSGANGVGTLSATQRGTDRTFGIAFAVPEPSSFALVLVGSLGLVGMRRRQ